MYKCLVVADLEGALGINRYLSVSHEEIMCKEVEFVFEKLDELNIEVYFVDSHNDGKTTSNLRLKYKNIVFFENFTLIDFSIKYDFAFLIGFHDKYGVGKWGHTFRDEFRHVYLGDIEVGEVDLFIEWFGFYKIPTIFISGEKTIFNSLKEIQNIEFIENERVWSNNTRKKYKEKIKNAVTKYKEGYYTVHYFNKPISIIIDDKEIRDKILNYVEQKEGQIVFFKSIDYFMNSLFNLAETINLIYRERFFIICRLYKEFKKYKKSFFLEADEINKILMKDYTKISTQELKKLYYQMRKQVEY